MIYKADIETLVNLQVSEYDIIFIHDSLEDYENILTQNDNLDTEALNFIVSLKSRLNVASTELLKKLKNE